MSAEEARSLIADVEARLRPLSVETMLATWEVTTRGTPEAQEKSVRAETRLREFLSSSERYAAIQELQDSEAASDPLLRRQLHLLALDHRPNQIPADVIEDLVARSKGIESQFHSFRAELDGHQVTDNQLIEILRTEADVTRRKAAWEASKQIAPLVASSLLELVGRRNEAARQLGYRDFYAMRMELQEIDEDELLALFRSLREITHEPYREAKADVDRRIARRYGTQPEDLRPWHYDDPFFQEPPLSQEIGLDACFRGRDVVSIAERFFRSLGLPLQDVLDHSDLYERAGKDQHAYCIDIDREGDVRILCNVKDDERWMGILLHELGHAAYDKFIPRGLPWILRQPAHIALTEAIAMFMDRLPYRTDWLATATEIPAARAQEVGIRAEDALRFESLQMARWVMVMTFFERELYADPARDDLDDLWWDLVEELQGLRRPHGREAPDWAAKIHLAVAPVYYHNYLLGELIASQLRATIDDEVLDGAPARGYVGREEVGAFLRDRVFAHGASLHWQDLLTEATGSALELTGFIDEFLGSRPRQA